MIIDPYKWHQLKIEHVARISRDIASVRVPRPARYQYQAGQYVVMRLPVSGSILTRQYSIVSAPQDDFLEFLIQREPGGAVSNWIHDDARIGLTIEISQPFGSFTLEHSTMPTLFIAGRVGIAPFISMVRDRLSLESTDHLTLLYSARGSDDFAYPELLEKIATYYFDTETASRITSTDLEPFIQPSSRLYVCGSKQFVDGITAEATRLGTDASRIRRELYTLQ